MSEEQDMQGEAKALSRIESAFDRLTGLIEEREALLLNTTAQPDCQEIAANIDALCVRIENVLSRTGG